MDEKFIKNWNKRYENYVLPILEKAEGHNGSIVNEVINNIRELNIEGVGLFPESISLYLKQKNYDRWRNFDVKENAKYRNFLHYYRDWLLLPKEYKDKIQKARGNR